MKLSALSTNQQVDPLRVFVVHWNSPVQCQRTVIELERQETPLRVTVIDNRSEPKNLQLLVDGLPVGTEVLRLNENLGWGRALNAALRTWVVDGPENFCVICAHDTILAPQCLSLIRNAMRADAQLGLACPEHGRDEVVRFSAAKGVHLRRAERGLVGSVLIMPAPHGTLSVLRRRCLQQIGVFDERYFAYGDETEIGVRAAAKGWKSGMVWGALVSNPGSSTSQRLRAYLIARNNILTVRLYFGSFSALLRAVVTLGSCIRPFWWAQKNGLGLVAARVQGIVDVFSHRYGRPPMKYFERDQVSETRR